MSGTTTSPTACWVDATGIHAPAFQDILAYLQGQAQSIFGSDVYLSADSQDGQLLGIIAAAIYDTNSMAVAVYNSYSPATAVGVGLSSSVKINGLARGLPTNSSCDLVVSGIVGTTINGGVASDANSFSWNIPSGTVISPSGQTTVTATAALQGAIAAPAGSINTIATPILGWQSVTNPADATPGAALEHDVALRLRQTISTMLPSVTALDGMIGAVATVSGVTRWQVYENDTSVTDSNGVPGHSISFVVEGGDATQIATAISTHKTPGAGTYGTTSVIVPDQYGIPHTIKFYRPTDVTITAVIHLTALNGFTTSTGTEVVNAVIAYINALPIGADLFLTRVMAAALSIPAIDTATFNLTSVLIARGAGTPVAQDVAIAFNEAAFATVNNVSVSVP